MDNVVDDDDLDLKIKKSISEDKHTMNVLVAAACNPIATVCAGSFHKFWVLT